MLRDPEKTRQYVQRYLRPLGSSCAGVPDATLMVFDLYRRQASNGVTAASGGGTPNWISGERHAPGEAFYDPVSGSFNTRILSSTTDKVGMTRSTAFRWEGFLAASIRTLDGPLTLDRQPQLELEPVDDQSRVYMTGIGARANSEGRRRVMPLRYLNSPDFDPVLAAKFTPKTTMRGWAGNPFFHPFVWNDIYLFDLVYDELGRIKEAIPVTPDASRPVSSFSERLTFTWDGKSKRLISIRGDKYVREMSYDTKGRLVFEKITHPSGRGKIDNRYQGDSVEATAITCEDDFFDRARRIVIVRSGLQ